jgi:pantothenate kinase-related protein Tda10
VIEEIVTATLTAPPKLGTVRLVAVDGPSGSGKSTLAGTLLDAFRATGNSAALVSTDDFATWDNPVAWWRRLYDGVLEPLAAGRPGRYQRTEWPGGVARLGSWVTVEVPDVLVIEGVSAGRRSIDDRLSCLVWVEFADAPARLARSVRRDGEASRDHLRAWQRFEAGWFAVDDPAARSIVKVHTG